jgi:hypothetical protein
VLDLRHELEAALVIQKDSGDRDDEQHHREHDAEPEV